MNLAGPDLNNALFAVASVQLTYSAIFNNLFNVPPVRYQQIASSVQVVVIKASLCCSAKTSQCCSGETTSTGKRKLHVFNQYFRLSIQMLNFQQGWWFYNLDNCGKILPLLQSVSKLPLSSVGPALLPWCHFSSQQATHLMNIV